MATGAQCHLSVPPAPRGTTFASGLTQPARSLCRARRKRGTMEDTDRQELAKILVVEDDPDIRRILTLFLQEKQYHVKVAESAPQALEMLSAEPTDLILADVRMPGMSGLDLLRAVKESESWIDPILLEMTRLRSRCG